MNITFAYAYTTLILARTITYHYSLFFLNLLSVIYQRRAAGAVQWAGLSSTGQLDVDVDVDVNVDININIDYFFNI